LQSKTLLLILLIFTTALSAQDKINLQKIPFTDSNITNIKAHLQQDIFNYRRPENTQKRSSERNNKLLVILVDFQEEIPDNPSTTGNGKFILDPDPDYQITLGAPPHDREYFEAQMSAMGYYYRAASYGAFLLEYDVYPKNKPAYTLPHEMAYYNPADSNLFTQRTELYFTQIFQTVDADSDRPERFSDYDHYMVIHAGSDSQHDVAGNTQRDLPSYYLEIGTGKDVKVDGGSHAITHMANVPETITQDVSFRYGYYRGYGAVNSVYAHEFGHSLGFADLYNTLSGYPAVGLFDIMDSGGSSALLDMDDYGNLYVVESIIPALPSAWSRILAWEDDFLQRGILVDIDYLAMQNAQNLPILAASAKRAPDDSTPYFYRIRLSANEYILIENRNTDPDGDGGLQLAGALDGRVFLHPTPNVQSDYSSTFEYDWILPGWIDENGFSYGGGLLIWHIDDNQIYHQQWIDGQPYTNLQLNRVNTNIYGNKAVRVIEADNIQDIGNVYSRFWTGTEWEYFFKYKPILNSGDFNGWSTEIFNDQLSSATKPALKTNDGKPSSWKIYDISPAGGTMTFALKNGFFDTTRNYGKYENITAISPPMKGVFASDDEIGIAIASPDSINYIVKGDFAEDFEPSPPYPWYINETGIGIADFPFVATSIKPDNHDYSELLLVHADTITLLIGSYGGDALKYTFDKQIIHKPFYYKTIDTINGDTSYLGVTFADSTTTLYTVQISSNNLQIEPTIHYFNEPGRFFFDGRYLCLLVNNRIERLKLSDFDIIDIPAVYPDFGQTINLPSSKNFTLYAPVIANNQRETVIYLMSDDKVIYPLYNKYPINPIFNLSNYTSEPPSQLALGYSPERNSHFILFHTASKIFVISPDGSLYPGFPLTLPNTRLKPDTTPFIFSFNNVGTAFMPSETDIIFLLHDASQGLLAVDLKGKIRDEYSQYWNSSDFPPQFFIENDKLYMLYSDTEKNVFLSSLQIAPDTKILWNGENNSGNVFTYQSGGETSPSAPIELYVYPNPIKQQFGYVRINNSPPVGTPFMDPKTRIKINIYNIAGQNVLSTQISPSIENFTDIPIDTKNLSTGQYFVIVDIDGKIHQTKFAIIK